MIPANELRIGSKVAMGIHHCTVNSIHTVPQTGECFVRISGFLDRDPQYQVYLSQLEPIPLTPEVLEACGFAYVGADCVMGWLGPNVNDWRMILRKGKNGFTFAINIYRLIEIQFLHELQNLFYSITFTELTYTPVTEKA